MSQTLDEDRCPARGLGRAAFVALRGLGARQVYDGGHATAWRADGTGVSVTFDGDRRDWRAISVDRHGEPEGSSGRGATATAAIAAWHNAR